MAGVMTQAELAQLHDEARVEMKKIPGVVGVGYGFKSTAGSLTDEVGFIVYVKEKKDKSQLQPEEIVPPRFKDVLTDVLTVPELRRFDCQDHTVHSPLLSGITVSNLKTNADGLPGGGTLGFLATINGSSDPHDVVLVSNAHVLMANGARLGDTIYQPPLVQKEGTWVLDPQQNASSNPAGNVTNIGLEGNHPYAYPGEAQQNYYVDCAAAKINICISTLCHTNCGQSFTNQVNDLNIPSPPSPHGINAIMDVARVQQADLKPGIPYVVYKSGRATSQTVGNVVAIGVPVNVAGPPPSSGDNGIAIMPTQPDCDGILQFATEGDSGAALLNAQGQLVGIVFGGQQNSAVAGACHIHPVLDFLKVTPVTRANPASGNPAFKNSAAAALAAPAPGAQPAAQPSVVPALRQRLAASEEGTDLVALVETHASEVVHLVNHQSRVMVAWHRNQGPQFLNEAVINAHDPKHLIPAEIGGVTRETLLHRMAKVLADYGSAGLQAALPKLGTVLPRLIAAGSLHDLIDSLGARHAV
jgi:hypothetical protein